ncbi:MAG: hypothetical protein Ct9H300mP12_03490 [Acidimicrobiales bacterium]|nr:MAG: hypothetical protein Ct9H300mP12_03490 [Acidimicrobiales bacterium]
MLLHPELPSTHSAKVMMLVVKSEIRQPFPVALCLRYGAESALGTSTDRTRGLPRRGIDCMTASHPTAPDLEIRHPGFIESMVGRKSETCIDGFLGIRHEEMSAGRLVAEFDVEGQHLSFIGTCTAGVWPLFATTA